MYISVLCFVFISNKQVPSFLPSLAFVLPPYPSIHPSLPPSYPTALPLSLPASPFSSLLSLFSLSPSPSLPPYFPSSFHTSLPFSPFLDLSPSLSTVASFPSPLLPSFPTSLPLSPPSLSFSRSAIFLSVPHLSYLNLHQLLTRWIIVAEKCVTNQALTT